MKDYIKMNEVDTLQELLDDDSVKQFLYNVDWFRNYLTDYGYAGLIKEDKEKLKPLLDKLEQQMSDIDKTFEDIVEIAHDAFGN